jgi:hypothetical protein
MHALKFDFAAVTEEAGEIIGDIVFYQISEQLVKRDDLRQKLIDAGLDVGFMPPDIRVTDAFRRATSAVERKGEIVDKESGMVDNYLVKEVSSDKEQILRFIVRETRDSKGKRLNYKPNIGRLMLNKESGTLEYNCTPLSIADEMCREAKDLFAIYQTHHDARAVRSVVFRILQSMGPTPMKESGGIYFVPKRYREEVGKLVSFIQSLDGGSNGYRVPVVNNKESKDMVRTELANHIKSLLDKLKNNANLTKVSKGKVNPLLEEAQAVMADFKNYQDALNEDLADLSEMLKEVRKEMKNIDDKIAAQQDKRRVRKIRK